MCSGKRNKCNNFEHNNNKNSNNFVKMCNMMAYSRKDNIISLKCHLSVCSTSSTHTSHTETNAHIHKRICFSVFVFKCVCICIW